MSDRFIVHDDGPGFFDRWAVIDTRRDVQTVRCFHTRAVAEQHCRTQNEEHR